MPYVERDAQNYVKGKYAVAQPGYAEEWLDEGHPDLSAKRPEVIAAEEQVASDTAARNAVKLDPVIQYLRDHTPDECEAWVQDNVTDLASAKVFLRKVAKVLCVLSKGSLR